MELLVCLHDPCGAISPSLGKSAYDPLNGATILVGWSEIPGLGESLTIGMQPLGKHEVARQGLQYMLPWSRRARVTNCDRLALFKCTENVGDKTIESPVSTANHIASPHRS